MADTARDIITESLLDLGVLAEGETPTAIQAAGALKKLNAMLDTWGLDGLMVYGQTRNSLPLVSGKTSYTIGTGGDLNIPRPNNITYVTAYDTTQPASNRVEYGIEILNNKDWAEVPYKSLPGSFPVYGVFPDWQYPFINLFVTPVPNSSQYALYIYTPGILGNLTIDQVIVFPAGYRDAIVSNLSIRLAPSYQAQVAEATALLAKQSMRLLANKNLQINDLKLPYNLYYDIRTDTYR